MPKIDPVTGCTVMTLGEFWQGEAKAEGKGREGWELQEDFYADMENERKREEDQLKDPAHALSILRDAVKHWNEGFNEDEEPTPMPKVVREVLEAQYSSGMSKESTQLVARVETEDGKVGVLTLSATYWSGSRMEPPDEDVNVEFKPD